MNEFLINIGMTRNFGIEWFCLCVLILLDTVLAISYIVKTNKDLSLFKSFEKTLMSRTLTEKLFIKLVKYVGISVLTLVINTLVFYSGFKVDIVINMIPVTAILVCSFAEIISCIGHIRDLMEDGDLKIFMRAISLVETIFHVKISKTIEMLEVKEDTEEQAEQVEPQVQGQSIVIQTENITVENVVKEDK